METKDIRAGQEFVGRINTEVKLIVTRVDTEFRGSGAVFAVNNQDGEELAYILATFLSYYVPVPEYRTLCQRFVAAPDTRGNTRAIWLEFDAHTGDVMSVTRENHGTPERLYGVPQLPDVGSTVQNLIEWIAKAQTSENILFYES